MTLKPMDVTPEVVDALATLRLYAKGQNRDVRHAINVLDDVGVFSVIDEATGYDVLEFERSEAARSAGVEPSEVNWDASDRKDMRRLGRRAFGLPE